jgi:hypothetical protein
LKQLALDPIPSYQKAFFSHPVAVPFAAVLILSSFSPLHAQTSAPPTLSFAHGISTALTEPASRTGRGSESGRAGVRPTIRASHAWPLADLT